MKCEPSSGVKSLPRLVLQMQTTNGLLIDCKFKKKNQKNLNQMDPSHEQQPGASGETSHRDTAALDNPRPHRLRL